MIKNAIFICDEKDPTHGEYFKKCKDNASALVSLQGDIIQEEILSANCNIVYLDINIFKKVENKTIFLIFSHGTDTSFVKNGQKFIEDTINCERGLDGGLVYTIACSTGKTFGKNIVQKNASFFGYDNEIEILPGLEKISIDCDIYGLYKIIKGETLSNARTATREKYNSYIDDLPMMMARTLRVARDSIVVHGEINKNFFNSIE